MKVVFLEDVPNVARAGEIKEVASGYGRNYLIPRKLALLADAQAISQVEAQRRMKARQQAESESELQELGRELDGREVTLKAKVGAKDHLYGSITNADIADELKNSAGLVVDKRKIELAEPIRQLGSYEVSIKLAKDIVSQIRVTVVEEAEKEDKKAEKEDKKAEKEDKKAEKEDKKAEKEDKKAEKEDKKVEKKEKEPS
jgi:large subunit ribosomal protein L9